MEVDYHSPCMPPQSMWRKPQEKRAIEPDVTAMYDAKSCPQTSVSVRAVHSMDPYFTRPRANMIPDAWPIGIYKPLLLKK
jgi:hypothetical protein